MKQRKIKKSIFSDYNNQLSKIGNRAIVGLVLLVFVGVLFASWQDNIGGQAGRGTPATQVNEVVKTSPVNPIVSGVTFLQQRKSIVATSGSDIQYFFMSQLYFELNSSFPQTAISVILPDNKPVVIPITKCVSGNKCVLTSQKWMVSHEQGKWTTKVYSALQNDNEAWVKVWKNPAYNKESLVFWTVMKGDDSVLSVECDETLQNCKGIIPISMNYMTTNDGNYIGEEMDESNYFLNPSVKLYEQQGGLCKKDNIQCVDKTIQFGVTLPNNEVVGLTLSPQNNFYAKIEDLVTKKVSSSKDIFVVYKNGYIGTKDYPQGVGCSCKQYQEKFAFTPIATINIAKLINLTTILVKNETPSNVQTITPTVSGNTPSTNLPNATKVIGTAPTTIPDKTISTVFGSCVNLNEGGYKFTQNSDGTYTLRLTEKITKSGQMCVKINQGVYTFTPNEGGIYTLRLSNNK